MVSCWNPKKLCVLGIWMVSFFAKNNARRDVIVAVFWSIAYISGSMLSCGSVEWRHHKQKMAVKQCLDAVVVSSDDITNPKIN